jgi:aryl-alcohol dehydrogenase-like predicted oxidoreductase
VVWILSRGQDVVPIVGARRRSQLTESLGALGLSLDAADIARIDATVFAEPDRRRAL